MSPAQEPSQPVDAYKAVIDDIVKLVDGPHKPQDAENRVSRAARRTPDFNEFVQSLSADQRAVLAQMLREERVSATHDVLASLSWWLSCGDVGLTWRGQPMPVDLSDMGLHGDFVLRLEEEPWPGEQGED